MKKLLAFLLVACMVATAAFCAFSVSAESTNIALGKSVTKKVAEPIKQYDADLTDGVAVNTMSWGATEKEWFSLYYNANYADQVNTELVDDMRVGNVVVDLAGSYAIDSVRVHFNSGYMSEVTEILVSADDKTYTSVAKKTTGVPDGKQQGATPAEGIGEVDGAGCWVKFDLGTAVTGQYVKVQATFSGMFCMFDEIEVYGTASATTEPEPEPVKEKIEVDGVLDDDGWETATWKTINKTTGTVQSQPAEDKEPEKVDIGDFEYKYAVRADAENIYIAVKTNAPANKCKEAEKMDEKVSSGSHLRLYITDDKDVTYEDATRPNVLLDVLYESDGSVGVYKAKALTTDAKAVLKSTDKETIWELSFKRSLFDIGNTFRMAVSVSDAHFGSEGAGYNVLNDHAYSVADQGTEAPWINNAKYPKYTLKDLALAGADVGGDTTTTTPPTETKPESQKPETGDTGIVVFAVLAILSAAGAYVAIRVRH